MEFPNIETLDQEVRDRVSGLDTCPLRVGVGAETDADLKLFNVRRVTCQYDAMNGGLGNLNDGNGRRSKVFFY